MAATSAIRRLPDVIRLDLNEGRSLRDLLEAGERPDRARLVEWGRQLLERLGQAHARGLACRRLDEDTVFVAPDGRLGITGFVPMTGEIYTAWNDLHAVGGLLRRLAFAGALRSDPLFKVLARATCADPVTRYGSAAEMSEALRETEKARAGARGRCSASGLARVAEFPGPAARRGARPAAVEPAPAADDDDTLWRALLLMVAGEFFLEKKNPGVSARVSTHHTLP
jgi:hypothetical protein